MHLTVCNLIFILCQLAYKPIVMGIEVKIVHEQTFKAATTDILATSLLLTIPPGDIGLPVHMHSGPVIGYIIEGEFLLQVDDEPPQIISAGNSYYQKDRSKHVWSANASNATTCSVLAVIYGPPGKDATIFVKDYKRESYVSALFKAKTNNYSDGEM